MTGNDFLDNVSPRSRNISAPVNVVVLGIDFEVVPSLSSQMWLHQLMLKEGGGVVVRPDQHILYIFETETTGIEISQLIKQHLDI